MAQEQQQKKQERISDGSAMLMVGVALVFDIISVIPVAGQAVADVGSFVVFLVWFLVLGLPLISPKKIATYSVSFVISVIPFLSILPEITLAIVAFILITRAEDKLGIQVLSSKGLENPAAIAGALKPQLAGLEKEGVMKKAYEKGPGIRAKQEQRRNPMNDILPPEPVQGYV